MIFSIILLLQSKNMLHVQLTDAPIILGLILAEHRTVAPAVAGSIPVSHPNFLF